MYIIEANRGVLREMITGAQIGAKMGAKMGANVGAKMGANVGAKMGANVGANVEVVMGMLIYYFIFSLFSQCIII